MLSASLRLLSAAPSLKLDNGLRRSSLHLQEPGGRELRVKSTQEQVRALPCLDVLMIRSQFSCCGQIVSELCTTGMPAEGSPTADQVSPPPSANGFGYSNGTLVAPGQVAQQATVLIASDVQRTTSNT